MPSLSKRAFIPSSVYFIMTEHPICCPYCQQRLDILESVLIEEEEIQINFCDKCEVEILMIEEDVSSWIY
jgi:hypothetical protein